ncbi:MAG: extracellular solute-binding protein [Deltaproteobacteria bacterium]|nr:extracellular solute-binding protein [Deltaproteobacteria bacterium]
MNRRTFLKMSMAVAGAAALSDAKSLFAAGDPKKWRQFEGETIRVLTENTPPSLGIKGALDGFTKLTGMKAELTLENMDALKEKMLLDLQGGKPEYHVNYVQCRPIGSVMYHFWEPTNTFVNLKTGKSLHADLPDVPDCPNGLYEAFMPMHVESSSIQYDKNIWYGLPYDTAQGIMFYRKDIFDKHHKKYEDQTGKKLMLTPNTTWEELFNQCAFLKKAEPGIAPFGLHYGNGWPIISEFNSLGLAYGVKKDGFAGIENPFVGKKNPGPVFSEKSDYDAGLQALEFMKKLREVMHPDVVIWEWGGLGTAFATGKIAMMRQCGEFVPYIEDPKASVAAGKTGYAVVPKGPSGINAYEMGCASLAIPKALPMKEKKKAWLFILWATGPEAQWTAFEKFYGTPVRKSAYTKARKLGWLDENPKFKKAQHLRIQEIELTKYIAGFTPGPKIPYYNEYLDVGGTELSKWVTGEYKTAKETLDKYISRVNSLLPK